MNAPARTRTRTPQRLADLLEAHLHKQGGKRMSFACESKDEAVLLAHELTERGWRAKVGVGLVLKNDEWVGADLVDIRAPRKKRA